jgi:hypothetical protein
MTISSLSDEVEPVDDDDQQFIDDHIGEYDETERPPPPTHWTDDDGRSWSYQDGRWVHYEDSRAYAEYYADDPEEED